MKLTRNEALQAVSSIAQQGILTESELQHAYRTALPISPNGGGTRMGYSDIFYYIGAFVSFLGVAVLIVSSWDALSGLSKLLVTLGFGLIAYIVGILMSRYEKLAAVSQSFHIIAGLVLPIGLYVTFRGAGFEIGSIGIQVLITSILFAYYGASAYFLRKDIFTLFTILYGTAFFFTFSYLLVNKTSVEFSTTYPFYLLLGLGFSYLFLGFYFSQRGKPGFSALHNVVGILAILISWLFLGGWSPQQNLFWEFSYPAILWALFYLSVYLHNRLFLVFTSIFLMIYLIKISAEYFSQNLGWPFALVLSGLGLIGVGYLSVYLNARYLSQKNEAGGLPL